MATNNSSHPNNRRRHCDVGTSRLDTTSRSQLPELSAYNYSEVLGKNPGRMEKWRCSVAECQSVAEEGPDSFLWLYPSAIPDTASGPCHLLRFTWAPRFS